VAEPGATITLAGQGLTTVAGAGGTFVLPDVGLAMGDNLLTLTATDVAGNVATLSRTLTRIAQVQQDPVLAWNAIALNAIKLDVSDPPNATRVLAIQSIAVYDTLAAIEGTWCSAAPPTRCRSTPQWRRLPIACCTSSIRDSGQP
jgi:hypothetical protein